MAQVDALGRRVGLRYLFGGGGVNTGAVLVNQFTAMILALSLALVWINYSLCVSAWSGWDAEYGGPDLSWRYRLVRRCHLVVHFIRCVTGLRECLNLKADLRRGLQTAVSQNKRRFIDPDAKLDLDLTYVCDRLIAMALPCVDGALYRNDIREVARFFSSRHYGHFLIFNLCEDHEEGGNGNYDPALLYNQVLRLTSRDHNAPSISALMSFCERASEWLNEDPNNVVAIHCQGGKGRTGTLCCALMLWTGLCQTAAEALHIFATRRTDFRRGAKRLQTVAAPGQIRALYYMEEIVFRNADISSNHYVVLSRIVMSTTPYPARNVMYVTFIIESGGFIDYDHAKAAGFIRLERGARPEADQWDFELSSPGVALRGDIAVRFFVFDEIPDASVNLSSMSAEFGPGARTVRYGNVVGNSLCFVSFHTAFHKDRIRFPREQIDGAYNKSHSQFHDSFSLELYISGESDFAEDFIDPGVWNPADGQAAGLTAGMPPSLRLIKLQRAFQLLMERLCPRTQIFTRGEMIVDSCAQDGDDGVRTLIYIVSGSAEVVFPKSIAKNLPSRSFVGAGYCFLGQNFLLGDEDDPFTRHLSRGIMSKAEWPVLQACSETVEVRRLEARGMEGPLPAVLPGLSVEDCAILFEFLAKTLTSEGKDTMLMTKLAATTQVKHDNNVNCTHTHHAQVVQDVIRKHRIPVSEALLSYEPANRVGGRFDTDHDEAASRLGGILLVFSNTLVFQEESSWVQDCLGRRKLADLVVPLKKVRSVRVFRSTLSLTITNLEPTSSRMPDFAASMFGRPSPVPSASDNTNGTDRKARLSGDSSTSANGPGRVEVNFALADNFACIECKRAIRRQLEDLHGRISAEAWLARRSTVVATDKWAPGFLARRRAVAYSDPREQEALSVLLRHSQVRRFAAGDVIVETGTTDRRLCCIESGIVAIKSPCGKVLAKIGRGDTFGEVSFLEVGNRGALCQVLQGSEWRT